MSIICATSSFSGALVTILVQRTAQRGLAMSLAAICRAHRCRQIAVHAL